MRIAELVSSHLQIAPSSDKVAQVGNGFDLLQGHLMEGKLWQKY
jgi:hypothetical protein